MSQFPLLDQLDLVEQQFNEVSAVVVNGKPEELEAASLALQQLSVDFLRMIDGVGRSKAAPHAVVLRLKALSEGVYTLRGSILRRAALVDQALKIVVPTEAGATYSQKNGPYGSVARQTGAFKVLAA